LQQEEGLQQYQLAKQVGVESPSMVRTLDGLEAAGLIERRPYANDRRSKTVHLTAAAHSMLNEMQAVLEQTRSQILAGLSEAEVQQFEQVVAHLNHNLQRLCAEQD
ncbi:MAG: MarR family transcriptional regulator, partial [Aeromonadales bacterium]|nr:MarR family transcriptional regulator [Aeromonadales bacterium]